MLRHRGRAREGCSQHDAAFFLGKEALTVESQETCRIRVAIGLREKSLVTVPDVLAVFLHKIIESCFFSIAPWGYIAGICHEGLLTLKFLLLKGLTA